MGTNEEVPRPGGLVAGQSVPRPTPSGAGRWHTIGCGWPEQPRRQGPWGDTIEVEGVIARRWNVPVRNPAGRSAPHCDLRPKNRQTGW